MQDVKREDFQKALKEMDTFIDINVEDLMKITHSAQKHAQLREVEQLLVGDFMTSNVKSVNADTPLRDAAKLLLDLRISGLPVVDESSRLVGIVTEADFLCALGIPCHHPAHSLWQTLESMFSAQPRNSAVPRNVADIMSGSPITVDRNKTLHDVIDKMKRHHVKRVVVVDKNNLVEGIITRSNMIQVILQQIL
jgi:CBS-domain-containing membrane protein